MSLICAVTANVAIHKLTKEIPYNFMFLRVPPIALYKIRPILFQSSKVNILNWNHNAKLLNKNQSISDNIETVDS